MTVRESCNWAHLRVYKPEFALGLFFRHSLHLEILDDSLGNSDARRPSTEEENTLIFERNLGEVEGADSSSEYDGASTLFAKSRSSVSMLK